MLRQPFSRQLEFLELPPEITWDGGIVWLVTILLLEVFLRMRSKMNNLEVIPGAKLYSE